MMHTRIVALSELKNEVLHISSPHIIFLYGDLGSWKTTYVSQLISQLQDNDIIVDSPTYVYYNAYGNIYHFDLYRLESYDSFVSIGWEEIFDNNTGIIFVEWPQLIEPYYTPDMKIFFEKVEGNDIARKITIER